MLDMGSWEFFLIIVLAVIVIGPKELPGAIRMVRHWIRRAKDLAHEFQSGLDDITRETEIDKVRDELQAELDGPNSIRQELEDAFDPEGEIGEGFDFEGKDWYSDHDDDADDDVDNEDVTGPPMAEDDVASPSSSTQDTPTERDPDESIDSDAKTGA